MGAQGSGKMGNAGGRFADLGCRWMNQEHGTFQMDGDQKRKVKTPEGTDREAKQPISDSLWSIEKGLPFPPHIASSCHKKK